MTETVFKAPKSKKSPLRDYEEEESIAASASKRPRTAEDFYLFCKFILEYENYDTIKQEEIREKTSSPLGSTGSVTDSIKSESVTSSVPEDTKNSDAETDDDSYDLVTCYCLKPFAGRPMIECSKCLTWVHLSCAKIKKSNIPEVFICTKCKSQKCTSVNSPSSSSSPSIRHKKRESNSEDTKT